LHKVVNRQIDKQTTTKI